MALALSSPPPARSAPAAWTRPWACPGLYHITPARDGGLCRLRLPAGRLSLGEARQVAAAAALAGAGIVEITNRANLQLRGIPDGSETALAVALQGTSLTRTDPATDRMRNIAAAPMAGLDPDELVDVGPIAAALWEGLPLLREAAELPVKFGVLLDGGGAASPYAGRAFDIVLSAVPAGRWLALGWGEAAPLAGSRLAVEPERAVEAVLAAASLLAGLAGPERRAATRIARTGRDRFETALEARLGRPLHRVIVPAGSAARPAPELGCFPQRQPGLAMVGAQPPLGRMVPAQLAAIADAVAGAGGSGLRLTPGRALLAIDVPAAAAPGLLRVFAAQGLSTDPALPLTRIVACAGSTGCAHGLTDTQADARQLAAAIGRGLPAGTDIHLSGCGKGCAHPLPATLALVATAPGRYTLDGEVERPAAEALERAARLATGQQ